MYPEYTRFADPGHSWLEVQRSELKELDIEHLISSYSYQAPSGIYLEEDGDLALFINAKAKKGNKTYQEWTEKNINTIHQDTPCWIRELHPYTTN